MTFKPVRWRETTLDFILQHSRFLLIFFKMFDVFVATIVAQVSVRCPESIGYFSAIALKLCLWELFSFDYHSVLYHKQIPRGTTVPPESICTSAAGFTRWTQGQCTRFALASTSRGTNEARDETETKPRELRVLQWPRLRALNCLCLLFVYVSLLVIRLHLPKRFSRKPQPPLAISSMHRSRLIKATVTGDQSVRQYEGLWS